jgi:hypothetical protein
MPASAARIEPGSSKSRDRGLDVVAERLLKHVRLAARAITRIG